MPVEQTLVLLFTWVATIGLLVAVPLVVVEVTTRALETIERRARSKRVARGHLPPAEGRDGPLADDDVEPLAAGQLLQSKRP